MIRRSSSMALVASLVLVLGGCGRGTNDAGRGRAGRPDSVYLDPTRNGVPAALRGPAIGPDDSLMQVLDGSLTEWVRLWKAARPEFELDSLRFAGWSNFHPEPDEHAWPLPKQPDDEGGALALVIDAPGERRRLLIDRYQAITGEEIGGDPDSAPVLADDGTGTTYTFEFCGTACGFHWAAWVDSTRFVLGGWSATEPVEDRAYGTLAFYDLERGVCAQYLVPVYSRREFRRYESAWQAWVLARNRALKARPPA